MATPEHTLVTIFLRGGLDGVGAVVPHTEDEYHRQRPTLALRPRKPGSDSGLVPLDDRFALHPSLEPLLPAYREGHLAIVHAVGSDDRTRSHFEAQDQMEAGASFDTPLAGGWIGRWLRSENEGGPFSAIAFGPTLPEALRGAPAACAVESLEQMSVTTRSGDAADFRRALAALHVPSPDRPARSLVCKAAGDALALMERVEDVRKAAPTTDYPDSRLGQSLAQVATLVREDVGLRVATLDHGGFDTHVTQAAGLGGPLTEFAAAVAAFDKDLGALRRRVTLVAITEFGRRITENTALGTDHGRGSCAFVLGGRVRGGRVLADWPGLLPAGLVETVDLDVTTDYRDLLWELLAGELGATSLDQVFPGLRHQPVGLLAG